jgi:hypothetical protein
MWRIVSSIRFKPRSTSHGISCRNSRPPGTAEDGEASVAAVANLWWCQSLADQTMASRPASFVMMPEGRHRLSDGRPIMVTAEFVPPASINSGQLISALTEKRPPLIEWNSHLYVVYGVIYDKILDYPSGATMDAIHKVLLVDTRFSDKRREVSFDRLTDNWGNVQGLLMLRAAPQYSRERLLLWGAGTSEMVGLRGDFIQLKSFRRAALGG